MASSRGRARSKRSRKKGSSGSGTPAPVLWAVVALVAVLAVTWWLLRPLPTTLPDDEAGIDDVLRTMALSHGVAPDALAVDTEIHKIDGVFVRRWILVFPDQASRQEFIAEATVLADGGSVSVAEPLTGVGGLIELRIDHGIEAFDLALRVARSKRVYTDPETIVGPTQEPLPTSTRRPTPPPHARGRLAILLDDAGQRMELVPAASALPKQVGVAVLPFLPYSTETAIALHEAGHEVWLHLPMEAVGDADPGPGALMVAMSDDELHDAIFMAINNIPHLVGVNNHMGSLATTNLRMMTWIMQDLAAMDLAFLDSRTTIDTVAEEAARAQGVRTGRRHVFLDNDRSERAIRAQLDEAVYRARMEGEAIAIGHLTEVTVGVLVDELPELGERRVTLVRPTELLR